MRHSNELYAHFKAAEERALLGREVLVVDVFYSSKNTEYGKGG